MRRFITRALCTLSLGAVLAVGVGVTAAAADTPAATSNASTSTAATSLPTTTSSQRMQTMDWWT